MLLRAPLWQLRARARASEASGRVAAALAVARVVAVALSVGRAALGARTVDAMSSGERSTTRIVVAAAGVATAVGIAYYIWSSKSAAAAQSVETIDEGPAPSTAASTARRCIASVSLTCIAIESS